MFSEEDVVLTGLAVALIPKKKDKSFKSVKKLARETKTFLYKSVELNAI
jgi:hypothetical protein